MEQLLDNRYRIVKPLGSGGMAEVYLAHDDVLDRDVALKVMSGRYSGDDEFVERFKREAQSAAALSHPNIVSIYDRGEAKDGTYYIAMEYLPGGTLKDRILKRGALPPRTAVAVALQIAEALQAAHRAGVVHRDIKPHNVLITDTGDIKVGDFGIARAASSNAMTKTGLILGTAHYISPEQAMGDAVGPQSDLYSLGVVLYEMLTGTLPYDAETSLGIAMKHVNGHLVPPQEINPEVPEGINAVTCRLLAKNPDERYADADELIEDLERVIDGLEPVSKATTLVMNYVAPVGKTQIRVASPAPPVASPPDDKRLRRRRWMPILLLLLLLSLLGGIAYATFLAVPRMVEVPDMVGATSVAEAQETAGENFRVVEGNRVESNEPVGTVVSQNPEAGEMAEQGSTVSVSVSSTQIADLPDVRGETREEAEQALEEAGFEVEEKTEESSEQNKNLVVEQAPRGGEGKTVEVGSSVTITVGEGPATVKIPELYNLTPEKAKEVLEEAGLSLGSQTEGPSDQVPAGQITDQRPAPNTEMGLGSSVDVTVSSGPERISIPNVVGQDWIAAAQKLRAAGLTVNQTVTQIQSYRPENEVLRTSPQAGSLVPPGTLVTLTTSQGPPPPQPANESSSNSNSNSSNSSSESSSNSNSSNSSSESKSTSKSKEDD